MIFATAAEYNPFHNGHAYHVSQMRKLGADGIIAVMSGSFVQRGEPAIMNKFDRAECAVSGGIDLVLELPVSYAVGSAERFAAGCVRTAEATGIADAFCFGSESADISEFENTVLTLESPDFSAFLQDELATGKTFAAARSEALKKCGAFVPEKPNDILAVEYIKEMKRLKSRMKTVTVKRVGDYHGGSEGFASASEIRRKIMSGTLPREDLPDTTSKAFERLEKQGAAPAAIERLERMILGFFRTAKAEDLKKFYAMTEGSENRIIAAARTATSIEDLYGKVKTKRYTMATVRRMVIAPFLQIGKEEPKIPFLRVLAFNRRGAELMKNIKKNSDITLVTVFTPELASRTEFAEQIELERRATDIFQLSTPTVGASFSDFTRKITLSGEE